MKLRSRGKMAPVLKDIRIELESLQIIENDRCFKMIVNGEEFSDNILDLTLERSWNQGTPWTLTLKVIATDKRKHMARIVEEEMTKR